MQQDEGTKSIFMILETVSPVDRSLSSPIIVTTTDPNFGDPNLRPAIALIPLGLSERGIRAISSAGVPGLLEDVLDNSRPIYTRMVHSRKEDGSHAEIPMPYGANGEAGNFEIAPVTITNARCSAFIPYLERRLQSVSYKRSREKPM